MISREFYHRTSPPRLSIRCDLYAQRATRFFVMNVRPETSRERETARFSLVPRYPRGPRNQRQSNDRPSSTVCIDADVKGKENARIAYARAAHISTFYARGIETLCFAKRNVQKLLPRREIPGGFVSCAFPFPCIPPGMARRVITTCTRWKLFGCTSKIHRRASRSEQIARTRAHDLCPTVVFSVIT